MNNKQIGLITEQKVIVKLLELGYIVSKVIGDNAPYDVVIERDSILLRAQIKSGRYRNGCVLFNTVAYRLNTKGSYISNYIGRADIFIIYCQELEIYLSVLVLACPSKSGMAFRVDKPKNNQRANVHYYQNFLLK